MNIEKEYLKINEIFYSIQGESTWAGHATVFVRTSGCPLRCTYCDTKYAYFEGDRLSVSEILKKISTYKSRFVCLTGGEPMSQKNSFTLVKELCDHGYEVSVETSGSIDCAHLDKRAKKILDVKTPDSGEPNTFCLKNLESMTVKDELKFVICSESDFEWAEEFIKKYNLSDKYSVLYSPSFSKISEKWLAKKILYSNSNARLQLQLHKYIWSPEARGV